MSNIRYLFRKKTAIVLVHKLAKKAVIHCDESGAEYSVSAFTSCFSVTLKANLFKLVALQFSRNQLHYHGNQLKEVP